MVVGSRKSLLNSLKKNCLMLKTREEIYYPMTRVIISAYNFNFFDPKETESVPNKFKPRPNVSHSRECIARENTRVLICYISTHFLTYLCVPCEQIQSFEGWNVNSWKYFSLIL